MITVVPGSTFVDTKAQQRLRRGIRHGRHAAAAESLGPRISTATHVRTFFPWARPGDAGSSPRCKFVRLDLPRRTSRSGRTRTDRSRCSIAGVWYEPISRCAENSRPRFRLAGGEVPAGSELDRERRAGSVEDGSRGHGRATATVRAHEPSVSQPPSTTRAGWIRLLFREQLFVERDAREPGLGRPPARVSPDFEVAPAHLGPQRHAHLRASDPRRRALRAAVRSRARAPRRRTTDRDIVKSDESLPAGRRRPRSSASLATVIRRPTHNDGLRDAAQRDVLSELGNLLIRNSVLGLPGSSRAATGTRSGRPSAARASSESAGVAAHVSGSTTSSAASGTKLDRLCARRVDEIELLYLDFVGHAHERIVPLRIAPW